MLLFAVFNKTILTRIDHIFFLLVLGLCSTVVNAFSNVQFTGKAYAVDSEQLLYVEQHNITLDKAGEYLSSRVSYSDPIGNVIVTKTLDFSTSQTMPKLTFIDKRINANIKVYPFNEAGQHTTRIFSQRGDESNFSEVITEQPQTSIIDAGFDHYVMANWQALLAGKTIDMEFLALTRAEYIGFELEAKNSAEVGDDKLLVLSLRPRNFFIRLLMKPIYLTYDTGSKHLLRFEGLTNIERVEQGKGLGENYLARIEYTYP